MGNTRKVIKADETTDISGIETPVGGFRKKAEPKKRKKIVVIEKGEAK